MDNIIVLQLGRYLDVVTILIHLSFGIFDIWLYDSELKITLALGTSFIEGW